MKTSEFLNLLKEHQEKSLVFEYSPQNLVGANYHITEIKNVTYDTVDCGARTDFWKETIVQLWESPKEIEKRDYLTIGKAFSIFEKVNKIKPMDLDSEIKFEYGNEKFHTAQLFVNDFEISNSNLIVKLATQKTACKANEICGVQAEMNVQENACAPGSGCC